MYSSLVKRAELKMLALIVCIFASAAMGSELVVSNVQVQQRPGTAIWDVTYDLQTVDGQPVMIRLFLSTDGGDTFAFQCQAVSGDVGADVEPGMGLQIEWNAGLDWPGLVASQCVLRVVADDSPHAEDFVFIEPGTFMMGSPENEPGRFSHETQHQVTLTKGFYMSKYEVTEQWWAEVMNQTPTASQLPKVNVSWDDAVEFCNTLSLQEGLTPAYTIHGTNGNVTWHQDANGYRLPTEAEWEYACRATTTLAFNNNTNCLSSDTEANYDGNYPLEGCPTGEYLGARTEVGSFAANPWGLYDMHGNVCEWVWCGMRTYTSDAQQDPVTSPGTGIPRVVRDGGWSGRARYCRSADRHAYSPVYVYFDYGFRPVRSFLDDPQLGTIHIDPQPSGFNAPWELSGPDSYSNTGNGAITLTYMVPGNYTISWGEVDGYITPSGGTQELVADGVIMFTGVYSLDYSSYFVHILPGAFTMGSPSNEPGRWGNEGPQHQVTLTNGFYMSKYEVTEEWWDDVMGSGSSTSQLPKNYVSWDLAVQFCNALSVQEGLTPAYEINGTNGDVTWDQGANGYRLPTEAEWEYASRATTTMAYHNDTNCLSSDTEANFHGLIEQLPGCPTGVYREERTEVGSFPANQFGLYDMHGNLCEWTWCGLRTYTSSLQVDPVTNAAPGVHRVFRGGDWGGRARHNRSAARYDWHGPSIVHLGLGLRPVRSAP